MLGFKSRKMLSRQLAAEAKAHQKTRELLIRRTAALQDQEKKAAAVGEDCEKLLAKAFAQDQEIKGLARVIIQASRGGSTQELEQFCSTADSLCERYPDLAPQPGTDG